MKYFTSDVHLGSNLKLWECWRPYKDYNEFAKHVVGQLKKLTHNDELYVLGDWTVHCFIDSDCFHTLPLIKHCKATCYLILGNSEAENIEEFFDGDFGTFREYCISVGWADVFYQTTVEIKGMPFICTHCPIKRDGYLNLFGHEHCGPLFWKYGININYSMSQCGFFTEDTILYIIHVVLDWRNTWTTIETGTDMQVWFNYYDTMMQVGYDSSYFRQQVERELTES